jgi:transposase
VAGLIDLCHVDEAGFAPTLPINYSWSAVGERLEVAYEAPQGRRVNAIGGYFSQGPQAGKFVFETKASLPKKKSRAKQADTEKRGKKTRSKPTAQAPVAPASAWELSPQEIGAIDADVFIGFIWDKVAARPAGADQGWRREVPVVIVLDNYSVHKSGRVKAEMLLWEAAGVHLFFLPSYSPKLSEIEPVWQAVKNKEMQDRSYCELFCLKRAVEAALTEKARRLAAAHVKTDNFLRRAA